MERGSNLGERGKRWVRKRAGWRETKRGDVRRAVENEVASNACNEGVL